MSFYSPKKVYTIDEVRGKIENYCAYQERCHKEVIEKLKKMGVLPQSIDLIVSELIQNQFLNEARFSKLFALSKFNQKKWGRQRIIKELKQRHISDYNIRISLKGIEPNYMEAFKKVGKKLCENITEKDPLKKRKKLINMLIYRGWESDLVHDYAYQLVPL